MPIAYDSNSVLISLIWTGAQFRSGGATTNIAFNTEGVVGEAGATALANYVTGEWTVTLRPEQDNGITLVETRWETANASGSDPVGLTGLKTLEGPPSNTALLVSYYGTGKGRRNRGRNYWPGFIAESQVGEDGVVAPTHVANMGNVFNEFFNDIITAAEVTGQSIAQSNTPDQVSEPILPWPVVQTRVVQTIIGTQRRRVRP